MALSRISAIQCLLLAAFLLQACGREPASEAMAATAAETRIVALSPHIVELVYAAGAGDSLVGAVEFSDYPVAAQDIPRVGDSFRIDYERLAQLNPSVILVWEAGNPPEVVNQLNNLGYRVLKLKSAGIAEIAADLRRIGELAGTAGQASTAARNMLEEMEALRDSRRQAPPLAVFFQISAEPYYSVSGDHVISEIIELCGGRNVFAGLTGLALPVSEESVIAANPDVILAARHNDDSGWKQAWQKWTGMTAVRNDSLYTIDRDLISRSGPRIVAGAKLVCAALDSARNQ